MGDKNIDLKKSSKRLKNKITYRIFILVGVGIFTPLMIIFIISSRFYYNTIQTEKDLIIENLRIAQNHNIEEFYLNLENEMKELIVLKNGDISNLGAKNLYIKFLNQRFNIKNIILLDEKYDIVYSTNEIEAKKFKDEFLNIFFSTPFYVGQLNKSNKGYNQFLYYKFLANNQERFLIFYLDDVFLNEERENKEGYFFEIINKDFHLINNKELLRNVIIDGVTKRMLDGEEAIVDMDGKRFSIGHIRVGNFFLYTRVYYDKSTIGNLLKKYIVMFALIGLLCINAYAIICWSLRKNMIKYTKSSIRIGMEEESDSRYPYLKYDIVELFNHTDDLLESLNHIEDFYYHIKLIKDRIMSQNKLLIKHKEDKEEIINRVKSDEKLFEEIVNLKKDNKD